VLRNLDQEQVSAADTETRGASSEASATGDWENAWDNNNSLSSADTQKYKINKKKRKKERKLVTVHQKKKGASLRVSRGNPTGH
jgi:hypothetical protein